MLDKHKAAEYLGVSARTLENYMREEQGHRSLKADEVKTGRGGKQHFFKESTLDEYKGYLQSLKATKRETPKSEETALAKLRSNDLLPAIIQRLLQPQPSKLVTRKQAAEESGLSVSVIEKAIRAGRLKEVKGVGKRGASVMRLNDVLNYASSLFD
jgi:hypothetical protein